MSQTLHYVKKIGLSLVTACKSEISNVCNAVEGHCLQVMKIVHHYAISYSDWLISEHQSIKTSRVVISILSGKYKRFTFVNPVTHPTLPYNDLTIQMISDNKYNVKLLNSILAHVNV